MLVGANIIESHQHQWTSASVDHQSRPADWTVTWSSPAQLHVTVLSRPSTASVLGLTSAAAPEHQLKYVTTLPVGHLQQHVKQAKWGVALTKRNTTGPPCSVTVHV